MDSPFFLTKKSHFDLRPTFQKQPKTEIVPTMISISNPQNEQPSCPLRTNQMHVQKKRILLISTLVRSEKTFRNGLSRRALAEEWIDSLLFLLILTFPTVVIERQSNLLACASAIQSTRVCNLNRSNSLIDSE